VTRRRVEATGTRKKYVGAAYAAAAHDPTVPTSHLLNLDKDASQAKQSHVRSAALRIAAAIIYAMSPAGRWKCLLAMSAVLVVAVMACWGNAAVRRCDRAQAGHVCHAARAERRLLGSLLQAAFTSLLLGDCLRKRESYNAIPVQQQPY